MGVVNKWSCFLTNGSISSDFCSYSVDKFRKSYKVNQVFFRLLACFSMVFFVSFYVMTDSATAGAVQEIKEEVKQGVNETKEEIKKAPAEFKKAGKDLKKKSEEVKKNVGADIEDGKKNVRSLTK